MNCGMSGCHDLGEFVIEFETESFWICSTCASYWLEEDVSFKITSYKQTREK